MPALQAARLMKSHHVRIAQAVVRQIQVTLPRYRRVDPNDLLRNVAAVVGGLQHVLESGETDRIIRTAENLVERRQGGGFGINEWVMAMLCFLPVMRRFLVAKALDPASGLEAYESLEAVAIPLVGRVAGLYVESASLGTDPDVDLGGLLASPAGLTPMTIEPVTGDDAVEGQVT
jgi:hypothetical protein